jgi:Uma2 family endonuclease
MKLSKAEIIQRRRDALIYPESDGMPMANNTLQFEWIVTIKGNLDILFADDPQVFVAGDLFWYPVEGDNQTRLAPDVMVAIGRPKGHRGSYLQWREGNIAPQVVFEILSPGNRKREMSDKFDFFQRFGVEEYYLYDPQRGRLQGWLRNEAGKLAPIANMEGWQSPRLSIRFALDKLNLQLTTPDGSQFLTFLEISQQLEEAEKRALEALWEIDEAEARADQAETRAEQAETRAEQAETRADQAETRAEQAETRADQAETQAARAAEQARNEATARAAAEQRAQELEARLRAAGLL